jgi:hypothetical protein
MSRMPMLAALLVVAPAPAVERGDRNVATCVRDAGGGRIGALAQGSGRFGATPRCSRGRR